MSDLRSLLHEQASRIGVDDDAREHVRERSLRRAKRRQVSAMLLGVSITLILIAGTFAVVLGRGDHGSALGSGSPAATLRSAVVGTMRQGSFHVEESIGDSGRDTPRSAPFNGNASLDFQAPDREAMDGTGKDAAHSISIGNTTYEESPTRAGYYTMFTPPSPSGNGGILGNIDILNRVQNVSFDGRSYSFDLPTAPGELAGTGGSGSATISDGLLRTFTIRYPDGLGGEILSTLTFSAYNSPITIEAPPADHIIQDGSPPPTCPATMPGGGVCVYPTPSQVGPG